MTETHTSNATAAAYPAASLNQEQRSCCDPVLVFTLITTDTSNDLFVIKASDKGNQ